MLTIQIVWSLQSTVVILLLILVLKLMNLDSFPSIVLTIC